MPIPWIAYGLFLAGSALIEACTDEDAPASPDPLPEPLEQPKAPPIDCSSYAGYLPRKFPASPTSDTKGTPEEEIPDFASIPESTQAIFRNPIASEFSSFVTNSHAEWCATTFPTARTVFAQFYDPTTLVGAALLPLKAIAIATGKAHCSSETHATATRFLNDFLQPPPGHTAFNYHSVVNGGLKIFMDELKKFAETSVNKIVYDSNTTETMVAAIQIHSPFADSVAQVRSNIDTIAAYVEQAALFGAKLIVTPELAVHGYADVDLEFNNPALGCSTTLVSQERSRMPWDNNPACPICIPTWGDRAGLGGKK